LENGRKVATHGIGKGESLILFLFTAHQDKETSGEFSDGGKRVEWP